MSANWAGRYALPPPSTPMTGTRSCFNRSTTPPADAGLVDEDGGYAEGLGDLADLVGEAHGVLSLEGDEALDAVAAAEADDGLVVAEASDVDAHAPGLVEVRAVAGRDEGLGASPRVAALALPSRRRAGCMAYRPLWVPAFAGMTERSTGMTDIRPD